MIALKSRVPASRPRSLAALVKTSASTHGRSGRLPAHGDVYWCPTPPPLTVGFSRPRMIESGSRLAA